MSRNGLALLVLLAALVLPASAQAGGFGPSNQPPPECTGTDALGSTACLKALEGGIEAQVDAVLAEAIAYQSSLPPDQAKAARDGLTAAHAAWRDYRDATCEAFGNGGGIESAVAFLQCRRWTAWQRVKNLKIIMGVDPEQESETEGGIEPYFLTFADTHYADRGFGLGDFSWNVKADYGARIVERVLVERGFEEKTARIVAKNWDAWRYHPETGQPLYSGPALQLSESGLVRLGHLIPDCIRDFAATTCKLAYAIEIGCRLDEELAQGCQRTLDAESKLARAFPGTIAEQEKFAANTDAYSAIACLFEGGKGAGLALFAPGTEDTVAKLNFIAGQNAAEAAIGPDISIPQTPRDAPSCKAIVDRFGDHMDIYIQNYTNWRQNRSYLLELDEKQLAEMAPPDRAYFSKLRDAFKGCGETSC